MFSKKKEEKPEEKTAVAAKDAANDKLIQIAVKFLQNPKVEGTSEEIKKAFLKKKGHKPLYSLLYMIIFSGLNDEDIKKAFQLFADGKKKPEPTQTTLAKPEESVIGIANANANAIKEES